MKKIYIFALIAVAIVGYFLYQKFNKPKAAPPPDVNPATNGGGGTTAPEYPKTLNASYVPFSPYGATIVNAKDEILSDFWDATLYDQVVYDAQRYKIKAGTIIKNPTKTSANLIKTKIDNGAWGEREIYLRLSDLKNV